MIRRFLAMLVLSAVAFMPTAASAELVTNGSFEQPDVATGGFDVFFSIPGWTTSFGPGIEIQDHAAGSPYDGNQLAELDSYGNSGMYQDLATIAGQMYHLSFAYSARPSIESNELTVFWGGAYLTTLAASGASLTDTSWTIFHFDLLAPGALTRLEFQDISGDPLTYGGYLDAISVTAPSSVPEPGTLVLLGAGLLGLARLRRVSA